LYFEQVKRRPKNIYKRTDGIIRVSYDL